MALDWTPQEIEWILEDYFRMLELEIRGERYSKVKTTKLGELTPIYVTRNELEFSKRHEAGYHVYRVFRFGTEPRFFVRSGAIDKICRLEVREWVGRW